MSANIVADISERLIIKIKWEKKVKKFKFSLEKVLLQRKITADSAIKEFSEARAVLDAEIAKRNEMIEIKERSLNERAAMIQQSSDWVNSVAQINNFVTGQDLRIKNQNLRLSDLEKLVEARREILRQRISEIKIIEKLEEKQKRAYMEKAAKEEQAELDEISVLRYSRNDSLLKGSDEDGLWKAF